MNKFTDELTGEQLYVAIDLEGGDLLGAVWAMSESDAYDYFNNNEPMIPDQMDRLTVELAEKSGYTIEEILDEFPDILDEDIVNKDTDKKLNELADPGLYEMVAARAMHFMHISYEMNYQEIADELGIDLQVVLDLIGNESDDNDYDDSDIMLEAEEFKQADFADLRESYRRTVSRGKSLNENELFVDFE